MTREEFYTKYGDIRVKFSSYYKYTFTFVGHLLDGKMLVCDYGGNHDEIYRYSVGADTTFTVSELEPYAGCIWDNGTELEGFYDY